MAFTTENLKNKYEDLGPSAETYYLVEGEAAKTICNGPPRGRIVYATGKYGSGGFSLEVFPHIILDRNKSTDTALKDLHLTPIGGSVAHTNPHTWYFGADALFIDPLSYAKLSTSDIKGYCQVLTEFIEKAFALQVTKFLIKKEVGGKYWAL